MGRDEGNGANPVFSALDDPDCRTIITTLSEPMTADELAAATEIPESTIYRKLDLLTTAGLLREGVEFRAHGQHASTYAVAFDAIGVSLTADRTFEVDITRRDQSADERLADIWGEVRKET